MKSERPIAATEVTGVAENALGDAERASAQTSSAMSASASTAPNRIGPGRSIGCERSSKSVSSCGALRSITTKRNSTMMAPA